MKKLLVVVALLLVALLVFLYMQADSLVEQVVERVGSEVTQVAVTLEGVDLALGERRATLHGLVVGNPPGFETDNAFALATVSVDLAEIGGELVHVEEVVVQSPRVAYEWRSDGSNIDVIARNVERYTGPADEPAPGEPGQGPRLVIDDVYLRDVQVAVTAPALVGREVGATIPEIHIEDIGAGEGGATPGEVAERILEEIARAVHEAVDALDIEALMEEAGRQIGAAADEAGKGLEEAAGRVGEEAGRLGERAGDALGDAAEDIGGLFGGKKKDDGGGDG